MQKLITKLTFSFLFLSLMANAQVNPLLSARLQVILDSTCAYYKIKGASAAILIPGVGMWKGATGISKPGTPITTDMVFGIGSNTKTYTSTIMLKLQEMGKISLSDTIGKWIPNSANINGKITIKQILNHTSGIFSFTDNPNFNDSLISNLKRIWKPDEILKFIQAPVFKAGTSWDYSNSNYLIAGIIISKVMNQPYEVVLRNFILNPQSLSSTVFFPEEAVKGTIPVQYSMGVDGKTQRPMTDITNFSNNAMFSFAYSAGAIIQSAEDNVNFWYDLYNDKMLNANSVGQMKNSVFIGTSSTGGGIRYGLGIFKYQNYFAGHTIYEHGGTNLGFINENAIDTATGICFSLLTNQDSVQNDVLLDKVIRALHKPTFTMKLAGIDAPVAQTAQINYFPNPATDHLVVRSSEILEPLVIRVYDVFGRIVLEQELTGSETSIETSQLNSGTYIARVSRRAGGLLSIEKIQVMR